MYNYPGQYIAHFGTLGMHWGIRKYQNKDGSLTPLGREHYGLARQKAYEEYNKPGNYGYLRENYVKPVKEHLGIKQIDENTELVPKGVTFQRICDSNEPLDSNRKYMSVLASDNSKYKATWNMLPVEDLNTVSVMTFDSTKDMKVATYKKVREELLDFIGSDKVQSIEDIFTETMGKHYTNKFLKKYGDMKVGDLLYDPVTTRSMISNKSEEIHGKTTLKRDKWLSDYLKFGSAVVAAKSDAVVLGEDYKSKFYDHMKKQGYDAFVDPFDYQDDFTYYPLVVMNPSNTMEKKSQEPIRNR